MEQEYYVEFTHDGIKFDYDFLWAVSAQDAENIITSIYGDVDITLIEEYKNIINNYIEEINNV